MHVRKEPVAWDHHVDPAEDEAAPLATLHPNGDATFHWDRIEIRAGEQREEIDDIQVACKLLLALRAQQGAAPAAPPPARSVGSRAPARFGPRAVPVPPAGGQPPPAPAAATARPTPRPTPGPHRLGEQEAAPPAPEKTRLSGIIFRLAWPLARALAMMGDTEGREDSAEVQIKLSLGVLRFADSVIRDEEARR